MILYNSIDVKIPNFKRRTVTNWIKQVAVSYNKGVGDISYIFCSDEKIIEINKEYLSHNYYTDVITFDYSLQNMIEGDIFISIDTVNSNSIKYNVPFIQELNRVMIHAILHLCGMNDHTDVERKVMTEHENKALEKLK